MSLLSRGRLIMKFVAVLRRLDPAATAAVVDGGFDDDFDEIVPVRDGTSLGSDSRRELPAERIRCQLARPGMKGFNLTELTRGGKQKKTDIHVTLFMKDLEDAGLITNGVLAVRKGDRIEQVEDLNGNVQWVWPNPPGLFVRHAEPRGYGIAIKGTPQFNLVTLHCFTPLQAESIP